ncbi:unnamed protein product [Arabidopsis halleri]
MDWTVIPRSRAESHEMLCHAARDYSPSVSTTKGLSNRGRANTGASHKTDFKSTFSAIILIAANISTVCFSIFEFCSAKALPIHEFEDSSISGATVSFARVFAIISESRMALIPLVKIKPIDQSQIQIQVKESELQNNDWIYLYLQLVLCAIERVRISDGDLSKLKIVKAGLTNDRTGTIWPILVLVLVSMMNVKLSLEES